MSARRCTTELRAVWARVGRLVAVFALLASLAACTTPGAIAPSTMPIIGTYVELGPAEEATSCGYLLLFLPVKNPDPLSDLIDGMIKSRGGDALIEVTSSSSFISFLLFTQHCVEVRGKVVNFTK